VGGTPRNKKDQTQIMPSNVFCKVAGIPGESSDDKHKDYFEVLSFSHGMEQGSAGDESTVGGHVSGRVRHQPFVVVKTLDKASPKLALACSKGEHQDSIVVECFRHLGENVKFMEYKMSHTIIRSIHPSGENEGMPTETVSFSYAKIEWTYTQYDNTGKKQGETKGGWDCEKNKPV